MSDVDQYKQAVERTRQDAAEGIVREPISGLRVEMEQEMLSKRLGLNNKEAHANLVEYLRGKDMSLDDFKRRPMRDRLDMVREALAV